MSNFGGIQLPNINEQNLDDEKERKQILNYLGMLDEKLRYMFQNLTIDDNFSEGAKKQYNEYVLNVESQIGDAMDVMSDLEGNYSSLVQTTNSISTRVSGLDENMEEMSSQITQTAEKIDMVVSSTDGTTSLTLTDSMLQAVSDTIELVGEVEIRTDAWGGRLGGYIGYGQGDDGVNAATEGIVMAAPSKTNYVIATESGVRMTAGSNGVVVTPSGISSTVSITVGSDRDIKNSIDYDMDKYEGMFSELKPCGYRYNSQPDGGTHLGFIAQDVDAVAPEGFGGVAKGAHYSLDYNNFIALNTHMIQKLMARIDELEKKVEALS